MSAYNSYDECQTVCICPNCKKRGVSCGPCMDCDGVDDTNIVRAFEHTSNGYLRECVEYQPII